MDELNINNIISGDEIDELFSSEESTQTESNDEVDSDKKEKSLKTTEVNSDTLFSELPESVSSGENNQEQEDTQSHKEGSISPNSSFYSSIAAALRDEGILPDLDNEIVSKIKTPEDFAEAMEKSIQSRLDEKQKRVDEALNVGVEVTDIKQYEDTLTYLDSLKEDIITDETEKGEQIRKQLIYQDFINRGFSKERSEREMKKSFDSGTDVEDAKEALESNKEFFNTSYKTLIKEAKDIADEKVRTQKKQAEDFKKSLLGEEVIFLLFPLDKLTRQKIFDNITKPVYKDSDGNYYTAIQKFELEHKEEFIKKLGLLYTLTNGFANLDNLVKSKVRKETRQSLKELEHVLNNTSRDTSGNLKYTSGVDGEDSESKIGLTLDLDNSF